MGLVVSSIITTGLIVNPSISLGASINEESSLVEEQKAPVYSKYIQIEWFPGMPNTYLYDDGMYRGQLRFAGGWWTPGGEGLAGGWLEGTVFCYQNCQLQ